MSYFSNMVAVGIMAVDKEDPNDMKYLSKYKTWNKTFRTKTCLTFDKPKDAVAHINGLPRGERLSGHRIMLHPVWG